MASSDPKYLLRLSPWRDGGQPRALAGPLEDGSGLRVEGWFFLGAVNEQPRAA